MDSLTHLMLSLAGGYLLAFGLGIKSRPYLVPAGALASLLIDVDHIPAHFGVAHTLALHNLPFVLVAGAFIGVLFGLEAGLVACAMLSGHLLLDMNTGLYGIPVFYPLSKASVMIPESWELWLFSDPSYTVVSRTGIALAAYLGLIALIIFFFSRRAAWRRRHTRTQSSTPRR